MDLLVRAESISPPADKWHLISICSPDPDSVPESLIREDTIPILEEKGCEKHLSLCFSDVTADQYPRFKKRYPEIILFSEEQAKEAFKFLSMTHESNEEVVFVVHCDAGISRSGAVAQFAADFFRINFKDGLIRPNATVYNTLSKVSGLRERRESDLHAAFYKEAEKGEIIITGNKDEEIC